MSRGSPLGASSPNDWFASRCTLDYSTYFSRSLVLRAGVRNGPLRKSLNWLLSW